MVVLFGGCIKTLETENLSGKPSGISPANSFVVFQAQLKPQGVNLGVAGNFEILSESGITDAYKPTITGDVWSSPITGAAILVTCSEVTGTIYAVDAAGPLP